MEDIKLYEYFQQYEKPELSEDTLAHHGIIGQLWGHRNGPPYPLSKKISTGSRLKGSAKRKAKRTQRRRVKSLKKARKAREAKRVEQQQIQKSKEEIIKSKDINQMLKKVDDFSNKEIDDMLKRLETENRLKEAVKKLNESNKPATKKVVESIKKNFMEGVKEGASQTTKQVGRNALKLAKNKLAELSDDDDIKTLLGYENKNKNKNKKKKSKGDKK